MREKTPVNKPNNPFPTMIVGSDLIVATYNPPIKPVMSPDTGPPATPANNMPAWKKCILVPNRNGTVRTLSTTVSALITAVKATSRLLNCIVLPFYIIVITILKSIELFLEVGDMASLVRVERISFSTPPELLKQFDDSLRTLGYKDRSKALQIAMRNFITEYAWRKEGAKPGAGAILLTYVHESHGLQEALTDIQHQFRSVVNSTTHIHLDESRCLEIISVRGKIERIQALAKEVMKKRGVTQLKLSTVAV